MSIFKDRVPTDIVLTYCPSNIEKDRICGHTFEVMDYFLVFYDNGICSTILIQEDIKPQKIFNAWEDKYNLPNDYKNFIKFKKYPRTIITKGTLIFTSGFHDGYLNSTKLIYKKLLIMRCNPFYNYSELIKKPNITLLQDDRVYKKFDNITDKNYIKKIYFKRYKKFDSKVVIHRTLIYLNSNLRKIEKLPNDKNYFYVSGDNSDIRNLVNIAPVQNLFQQFTSYLYTKTTRQFDCSPRLITECKFYNKKVFWDFDFDNYANESTGDTGLYWRQFDIERNFNKLHLDKDDEIFMLI